MPRLRTAMPGRLKMQTAAKIKNRYPDSENVAAPSWRFENAFVSCILYYPSVFGFASALRVIADIPTPNENYSVLDPSMESNGRNVVFGKERALLPSL